VPLRILNTQDSFSDKTAQEVIMSASHSLLFEIHYQPLSGRGPELCFPCDADGQVSLDSLSDRARNNYLYARAVVGREYAAPAVLPCELN
jgi:hypothetical protein